MSMENVYMYGRATAQPFSGTHPQRAHTNKGKLRGRMAQDLVLGLSQPPIREEKEHGNSTGPK